VAGVVNPPAAKKRNYWRNDALVPTADAWMDHAQSFDGSWWVDWFDWLRAYGGGSAAAPSALGNKAYPVIEAAPGRYVKVKA
jgi:polyhydroxyalkanoate synthase